MNRLCYLAALLAAPILLLSSCIDSREEIWLHPSGGGMAHISVTLPASVITLRGGPDAVASAIDDLLAKHPSIVSVEKNITTAEKRSTIDVSFRFNSALELSSSMSSAASDPKIPAAVRHFMGKTLLYQDGLTLTGERIIDIGKAIPSPLFLPHSQAGHQLQTILHLPLAPTEHNATRVENEGRTLIWDIPLTAAMRAPHIQRIQVRPSTSLLAAISLTTSILLTATLVIWRKRRNRRIPKKSTTHPSTGIPQT